MTSGLSRRWALLGLTAALALGSAWLPPGRVEAQSTPTFQHDRIPDSAAGRLNLAWAESSCTEPQRTAEAVQVDRISRSASSTAPENGAVAVSVTCRRCVTVAQALQYVLQGDDPDAVPRRAEAVIARFSDLAQTLNDQRSERLRPPTGP